MKPVKFPVLEEGGRQFSLTKLPTTSPLRFDVHSIVWRQSEYEIILANSDVDSAQESLTAYDERTTVQQLRKGLSFIISLTPAKIVTSTITSCVVINMNTRTVQTPKHSPRSKPSILIYTSSHKKPPLNKPNYPRAPPTLPNIAPMKPPV